MPDANPALFELRELSQILVQPQSADKLEAEAEKKALSAPETIAAKAAASTRLSLAKLDPERRVR